MPSFTARFVWPLCKLLEGYMVCILNGKSFVLEASSVCSNVVPSYPVVEQTGTLCVSLLTRHYACRDLDDEKEGTLRGGVFFFLDLGVFFLNTKSKSKSGLRERDFLHWSLAKGG